MASRARPIKDHEGKRLRFSDGREAWFDVNRNGQKATAEQVELLATIQDIDLDDLLDEVLTQGDVVRRINSELGHIPEIPATVLANRQKWRIQRQTQPKCRKCEKVGDSTKHHFVNRWILKELDSYERLWSDRSENCIPICIDCHRDLHYRGNGPQDNIAPLLSDKEKDYAQRALQAFADQHPRIFILVGSGDASVYEAKLIQEWMSGAFRMQPRQRHLELVS